MVLKGKALDHNFSVKESNPTFQSGVEIGFAEKSRAWGGWGVSEVWGERESRKNNSICQCF
ncbi:hypothetical protein D5R40_25125 [Okeania hirsuta]|uniref:Uncharacterized protein n=1 Tax=Okeania hirsuta TaxID=1458930 RepID=A0A3N6NDK6_9CYAN|nr:hypothetical protein D4Z78_23715 [Okeania hirsuta]RQH28890.1 hypothetical protein D5R40_25125 [Okeania hirsuta]